MNFLSVILLCVLYQNVSSYRILAILPAPSKSHTYIGKSLMKGLAENGHDVVVISPFKEKNPIDNYTEVFLENSWIESRKSFASANFADFNEMYFWELTLKYIELGRNVTNWAISSQNLQNFLKTKQHFDVVVVEICFADALLGVGLHFNAPIIGISAFGASKWTSELVGSPNFASYVPFFTNHYTDRMTFFQRVYNSLSYWFEDFAVPFYFIPEQQAAMEKLFPEAKNWPSLEEIRRNVSLVLLNSHAILGTPRPYAPNMIDVGGMQIQKVVKPLQPKIQRFLDEAKAGAIFISLGSNVVLTKLPNEKLSAITNAFHLYPSYRILIKSDEHIIIPSHNETDVLIEPWFNQQSILAHENIKLFVTHGGLLSTTEAVYFGKPLVGIPFFFDQHLNMHLAEQKGFAINVPIETLTAERIATAVRKVLGDPSYAEHAKIVSDRFRDQPLSPLETAMHWVKHVAKNRGAPHLRSVAVDLPFHKLYNLDVWAFIIAIFILTTLMLKKIIQIFISLLIYPFSKKKLKTA